MGNKVTSDIYIAALGHLRKMFGEDARFKEDQFEAIEKVIREKRVLVSKKPGGENRLFTLLSLRF